jgi:hypothetical protein
MVVTTIGVVSIGSIGLSGAAVAGESAELGRVLTIEPGTRLAPVTLMTRSAG